MSTNKNTQREPTADMVNMPLSLGAIVATPGAIDACSAEQMTEFMGYHRAGNWGVVDQEDWIVNNNAAQFGGQVLSAYTIDISRPGKSWGENCLWIITERDRSVTTMLLPNEY